MYINSNLCSLSTLSCIDGCPNRCVGVAIGEDTINWNVSDPINLK